MRQEIADKIAGFPAGPGVYVFTAADGKALYVGKAANLRARLRSYLRPGGDGRPMLPFLEREAQDVEFVAVATEQEALLLENTIIKKRKPRYNVKLRDDKSFLMLRLDRAEQWPWFRLVRRRRDDGAEYFGPYASAKSVRRTLRLLHKVVPLRDCKDGVFHNRSRPCIKFEIGRCPAPCVGRIDRESYGRLLDEANGILRGRSAPVLRRLRDEMDGAADRLEFERAQELKTQIEALAAVAERQSVIGASGDQDAVGIARSAAGAVVVILQFRSGRLESRRRFDVPSALPDGLLLADVLARFYEGDRFVPAEILVPAEVEEVDLLSDWLSDKRGSQVSVRVPQRGAGRQHVQMAIENARLCDSADASDTDRRRGAALALGELVGLADAPLRIHCLDVSTMQGRDTVASRVCFVGGAPDKGAYRRFRIGAAAAGDDFASMDEAVRRSLTLCVTEDDDELPDLLIVDGGGGQVSAAKRAADELGLGEDLAIVGLAKSRLRGLGDARRAGPERLFAPGPGEPVALREGAAETLLVTALRDEAHRFAITYHRKVRGTLQSELDRIPGVGPARRRLLLRHFGSLRGVRAADLESLRHVPGLPDAVAEAVHDGLRGGCTGEDAAVDERPGGDAP